MPRVTVGDLDFRTKGEAKDYFRDLRDKYADGEIINVLDSAHLLALVSGHSEAETKIGCGIENFTVERDNVFRTTRHFVIHRTDSSFTDFSFLSCLDGRNPRKDRLEALRREIEDQVISFRTVAFTHGAVRCEILGVDLMQSACHVDHSPPQTFISLVESWMRQEEINIEALLITPPGDNQIVTRMIDGRQKISWDTFHKKHAKLRILSPLANLSHAKRKVTT